MEIIFGKWVQSPEQREKIGPRPVKWRADEVINGHILLAGASGTGKTHNIREIIAQLIQSTSHDLRFHVFDVHDDIDIAGASEVFFSESSDVGLNPLVIDDNPHSGGVRKGIQNFIGTLNKTSRKIGDRQEAVLRAVLEDLYSANGFYINKPESWSLHDGVKRKYAKKFPNMDDLHRWTYFKYKQMFMGGNNRSAGALDRINKEAQKIQRLMKGNNDAEINEKLPDLKDKAIDAYSEYITSIKSGRELEELLKFDSKTTLKSVLDRIDNLRNSGVFCNQHPDFDPNASVWRYRLKSLSTDEKKMFVLFRLKELYDQALRRGPRDKITEFIVIDEANMFMDSDPDNIINILANEIRKFGVALMCASQSFTHFTDDFMASAATKIILGIDELFWDKTARQLQINKKMLEWITPRRSALIQLKRNVALNDPTAKVKWFYTALGN
jgi:DNA helicase HerA-like ATPase